MVIEGGGGGQWEVQGFGSGFEGDRFVTTCAIGDAPPLLGSSPPGFFYSFYLGDTDLKIHLPLLSGRGTNPTGVIYRHRMTCRDVLVPKIGSGTWLTNSPSKGLQYFEVKMTPS